MMMKLGPGEDEVSASLVQCSKHTSLLKTKPPLEVYNIISDLFPSLPMPDSTYTLDGA